MFSEFEEDMKTMKCVPFETQKEKWIRELKESGEFVSSGMFKAKS